MWILFAFGSALFAGIAAGTWMMLTRRQEEPGKELRRGWFIYAALSAVFASFTSILGKIGIEGVESRLNTAVRTAVVLIMAWGSYLRDCS